MAADPVALPGSVDLGPIGRSGPLTLGQVLNNLGIRVLDAVVAPHGLDIATGETVVVGVGEPLPLRPGGIVLAAGSGVDTGPTCDLIRAAARAGYAAVVIKVFAGPIDAFAAAARTAGIALLRTPDDLSWRHLDALLGATGPTIDPATDRYASAGMGDLFALANAIAATVGGALTIEDPHGRVLAYSNLPYQQIDDIRREAILGLQTPERPTNHAEYRSVFAHDGPVLFEMNNESHADRLAVGLRAGRRPLGILWVISGRPPLAPNAVELLADAGRVVELHLLRLRGTRDPARWRRTEALRAVLDERVEPASERADLGLGDDDDAIILAIAPLDENQESATVPARIVDVVTLLCDSWDPLAACVSMDGTVYAMVPVATGDRRLADKIRRLGQDIVSTARRAADLRLLVAIGSTAHGRKQLPSSRRMADRVMRIHRSRAAAASRPRAPGADAGSPSAVAAVDDLPEQVALLAIREYLPSGENLTLPAVRALLADEDAGGTTPYASTVLAYLGTMGDMARTAAALNIHENTVRYRIRRARDLFRLDLSDPDTALVTWLQLRLARPDGPMPYPPR